MPDSANFYRYLTIPDSRFWCRPAAISWSFCRHAWSRATPGWPIGRHPPGYPPGIRPASWV